MTAKADLDLAAKRIAYAKFLNAGQICLSVNHVFVDSQVHDAFLKRLHYWTQQFSGGGPRHMCKIVNKRNFERLSGLLENTSGNVFHASGKEGDNMLSPTVVTDVSIDGKCLDSLDAVMTNFLERFASQWGAIRSHLPSHQSDI